jgi:adenosine deaminase
MKLLIDQDITLDMCPISNYKLRVIDRLEEHPIKNFMKKGIRCTVSTDDPLSFNNSLTDEFVALYEKLSLSFQEIAELIANGFHVADLEKRQKNEFLMQIDQQTAKLK